MKRYIYLSIGLIFFGVKQAFAQAHVEDLADQIYDYLDADVDKAIQLADSCLMLAKDNGLRLEEANTYFIKGYIYDEQNDLAKALIMYLKSSALLDELDSEESVDIQLSVLLNSGSILDNQYKYPEAIEIYDRGLALAELSGNASFSQQFLYNKAATLRRSGELNAAVTFLTQSVEIAKELSNINQLIKCWNLFGLILKDNGDYNESRKYYSKVVHHPSAKLTQVVTSLHNTATTFSSEGLLDSAEYYLNEALDYERQLEDPKYLFATLHDLADLKLQRGQVKESEEIALACEALFADVLFEPETFKIYHLLTDISYQLEDWEHSKVYHDKYFQASQRFEETRSELVQQLEKFQVELIIAGFEAEQKADANQQKAQLWVWVACGLMIVMMLLIIVWRIWFSWWRRDLWDGLFGNISEKELESAA